MRLVFLISVTMVAFASNSVLNRMAVDGGWITPLQFAGIRVLAGAVMLLMLVRLQARAVPMSGWIRAVGATSLAIYMLGFSLAYTTLDAGLGALILFGVVQITMFCATAMGGTAVSARQVSGAAIAFAGLAWVLWPGKAGLAAPAGAVSMALAGVGWAAYSLAGRREPDALASTAANFLLCLPLVAVPLVVLGWETAPGLIGIALAVLSGAVTSGLGYALWYRVLPQIPATSAATVQLSVPVIAILAGAALLAEPLSWRLIVAAGVVLGGIALAIRKPQAG